MSKAGKKKDGKGKDGGLGEDSLQAEKEREDLARFTKVLLELEEAKLKVERLEKENDASRRLVEELRAELTTVKKDAGDVMEQMKREIVEKTHSVERLTETVAVLQESVAQYEATVAALEKDRSEVKNQLDNAATAMEEKGRLEDTIRSLNEALNATRSKIDGYKSTISSLQQQLQSSTQHLDDLTLELARSTSVTHVAGCEWTLKRYKQRLVGDLGLDVPTERERCSLTAVGRMLVMFGGTTRDGNCTNDIFAFNSDTMTWTRSRPIGEAPAPRSGHVAVLLSKKRVFVFGGRRNPLLNDSYVLHTDKMTWTAMKTKGTIPAPVEKACATFVDNQVLLTGGNCSPSDCSVATATINGEPIINISRHTYLLDLETKVWSLAEVSGPTPIRCGATLTLSNNGRFVFAFGGYDEDGAHYNDVHVLSLQRWEWSKPEMVMGNPPAPRESHTASMIGRYLLISGGSNGSTHFLDTFVFDTEQLCWECLDSGGGSEAASGTATAGGVGVHPRVEREGTGDLPQREELERAVTICNRLRTFTFLGSRLLSLSAAGTSSQLVMLDVLDISMPEDAFQSSHIRSDQVAVEARQVPHEFRMIEILWRPPPRHKARITEYKVMMSVGRSSSVKAIYSGKEDRCRVIGARPGFEYLFRVKGEYSDGGCAWSDITSVTLKHPDGNTSPNGGISPIRGARESLGAVRKSESPTRPLVFLPSSSSPTVVLQPQSAPGLSPQSRSSPAFAPLIPDVAVESEAPSVASPNGRKGLLKNLIQGKMGMDVS